MPSFGTIKADTLTHSTAGSLATNFVVNGSAKSWVNFDGTASGAAARDSFNVASMTDDGTGQYTVTFSSVMANANYAHNVTVRLTTGTGAAFGSIGDFGYVTNEMGIYVFLTNNNLTDAAHVAASLQGDLA